MAIKNFDVEVEVRGDPAQFKKEIEAALPTVLAAVGTAAEGYAKEDCPVDTGLLRNSITYAIAGGPPKISTYKADNPKPGQESSGSYSGIMPNESNNNYYSVFIGTNVKYAEKIEFQDMTHKVGKAHFLRDAIQDHRERYKDICETGIKAAIGG